MPFELDFTLRTVALGAAVLGLVSGTLGTFAVLRGQSLLGDAISHAALPGIALAFLLTGMRSAPVLVLGAEAVQGRELGEGLVAAEPQDDPVGDVERAELVLVERTGSDQQVHSAPAAADLLLTQDRAGAGEAEQQERTGGRVARRNRLRLMSARCWNIFLSRFEPAAVSSTLPRIRSIACVVSLNCGDWLNAGSSPATEA